MMQTLTNKTSRGSRGQHAIAVAVITFLVLFSTAAPLNPVSAQPIEDFDIGEPGPFGQTPEFNAYQKELERAAQPSTASKGDKLSVGCGILSLRPGWIVYWILDALTDLIVTTFVSLASLLFNAMVNTALATNLAATPFVTLGFNITLGVANIFFVLILLWIAIATIFDFEPYTARSLLPRLIIAALLINFSLAIGSSIIRLSNGIAEIFHGQLMKSPELKPGEVSPVLKDWLPATGIARRVMLMSNYAAIIDTAPSGTSKDIDEIFQKEVEAKGCKIEAQEDPFRTGADTRAVECANAELAAALNRRLVLPMNFEDSLLTALQAIFWKLLMVPVLIFVLFAGIIFIIIRQVSLAFILVLGPMAFLFMILPATQRFYNQWWERLFQWSFFLPAFMFFLFLSLSVGSQLLPANLAGAKNANSSIMVQYFMTVALLIGSLLAANQMGIWGASTVTGWGKKMAGAAGGYVKNRGWKYAGKGTEAVMGTGVMRALGRIPIIGTAARAAATAVMKKGVGVEKKDIEFYSKLPDRQLATVLSTMSRGRAEAFWENLPAKRKRQMDAKGELAALARNRGWTGAPPEPTPPSTPQQSQNQAIQNQMMPIIREAIQNLPQNIQSAVIQGMEQAIQNLPLGVKPHEASQVVLQKVQDMEKAAGPDIVTAGPLRAAASAIRTKTAQMQTAVEQAQRIAARPPTAGPQRPITPEEYEERLEEAESKIADLEERKT